MTADAPRICCFDLDTFFVSVERLFDPSLVGKPVVVGGKPGQRGVVVAASYEVRALGVRSGMSLTDAGRLAPDAIYVSPSHGQYGDYSKRVREMAHDFCPHLQIASIDEFYLDFTGCERMYRKPGDADHDATILRVVRELTAAIQQNIGLPSSAGIATSKPVSKIACRMAKPAGVRLVPAGTERALLAPLPVRELPGVGPVGERKLARHGITTLGQLSKMPLTQLERLFGKWAPFLSEGARGEGNHQLSRDRPAFKEHDPSGLAVGSISNEQTFRSDVGDHATVERVLCGLVERVCWRARRRRVKGRTITLRLRYANFETLTRGTTQNTPTSSELEVYPIAKDLLTRTRDLRRAVRLIGVGLSNLEPAEGQLQLFDAPQRQLHEAVDELRERFGYDAVRVATGNRASKTRGRHSDK